MILFNTSALSMAPLMLRGLWTTATLWVTAAVVSLGIGALLGILSCTMLRKPFIAPLIGIYVFVMRGVPVYVQVLIVYFVLPELLGVNLSPFMAAVTSLGLCSSGYITEIVRCGIDAVPRGQWEACAVLGFGLRQTLRFVVLPQAIRTVLPALANEMESLIKSTAIVSTIGVLEITRVGSNIVARYMNPIPVYLGIACLYLLLSLLLKCVMSLIKRRFLYERS